VGTGCPPSASLAYASQRLAPAQVRGAFDFAYQQLAAPCDVGESLLERLIRCASSGAAVACRQSRVLLGRVAHRRGAAQAGRRVDGATSPG
jgi:hypothetical protein